MRYLIVSDIHANLVAFETVIQHAGRFDGVWCLGDVVGYGPNPNECIERLRSLSHVCVAGNHDYAALGKLNLEDFNVDAQASTRWTEQQLTPDSRAFLESLPERYVEGNYTLVHGSPREPIWEYLLFPSMATPQFAYFDTPTCFVGHTHAPVVFTLIQGETGPEGCEATALPVAEKIPLGRERQIVNPGSVGQPRDGDPRAGYAILDTELHELEHFRIDYPVHEVQKQMTAKGLPPRLIARLGYGW